MRLMRDTMAQEAAAETEQDFDRSMDDITPDDDKTFAAMGVAKTISTVCSKFC